MQYRKFGKTGIELSVLGFGTMRFPLNEDKTVDEERAVAMIRSAIDKGLNYVDTAYPYHQGTSENVVGKALLDGYREKAYLATKCPVWLLEKEEDFDRYLDEQLEKLQTDSIDFYLLHALNRSRYEDKVKHFRLTEKLEKARAEGKIKYIGFSFHDSYDLFQEIIDDYSGWDFCQIQYNYINLDYQAGKKGLQYAASRGLGVIIMEPLLGGQLANLTPHVKDCLGTEKTPVEYALDFLWDQPEVGILLSGMSDEQQVEDNLCYADRSHIGMLTGEERLSFVNAKEVYDSMALVNCTKCAYCMPCPFGLPIPEIFKCYNQTAVDDGPAPKAAYQQLSRGADSCRSCGHCEKECPQNIPISQVMKKVSEVFK